ncbi:MAG: hypothetical protein DWQ02_20395 [Bacteroidetes bacterium]|nr:MAG: hypothetical protein DWQ02_20395 [Bacteroidota bacterium]
MVNGFTEDLTINLSKFIGLSVISQYSTQHIKGASDKQEINRLGADYFVSGSFRVLGDTVRIGFQLVKTNGLRIIFAKQYDQLKTSVLEAMDEIVEQVVSVLRQQINYDLLSLSYKKEPVQLAAYENWLLGMDLLKKGSLESDLKARTFFEAALKIDPGYARAYTGLSLSYFNEWSCQLWSRWDVSQKGAHEYALKALELDENDYVSLAVLGRTYLYSEEFEKAEHYLRKSLRMNPNDSDNLIQVAFSMMFLGYAEEAERLFLKACKLNPMHQDGYFSYGSNIYLELGQFEKCIELSKKVKLSSCWVDFPVYTAAAYFHLEDLEKMTEQWELFLKQFENQIYSGKGHIAEEALQWHKNVNPYKGETRLKHFWTHIGGDQQAFVSDAAKSPIEKALFVFEEGLWRINYKGETIRMKDAKGLRDIAKLLITPETDIHVGELMGIAMEDQTGVKTMDEQFKQDVKNKLSTLQAAIQEAEALQQYDRLNSLRVEYDQLIDHLSGSLGLAGKPREIGSTVEKARSAVTLRIRGIIKKIGKDHPGLGRHLANSIQTGTFCSYRPEEPVNWQL